MNEKTLQHFAYLIRGFHHVGVMPAHFQDSGNKAWERLPQETREQWLTAARTIAEGFEKILGGDSPLLTDAELAEAREMAEEAPLNSYYWCETQAAKSLIRHIDAQASQLRWLRGEKPEVVGRTYFNVEVCDDHDGGSVWYVDEDYMEEGDAIELAKRTAKKRANGLARVNRCVTEVVAEYRLTNGSEDDGNEGKRRQRIEEARRRQDTPLSPDERRAIGIDPTPAADWRDPLKEEG
ncbi:MAG TPA: hypothetical protein VGK73_03905 [Polyangiaceae bacterium]